MNHVYKVPVIPHNLSKQETIIQVAEVLDHLSNVTDDLLKHINDRVELNRKKINNIFERVAKVNEKIKKLTGAKKATQVFSSSKYPAAEINQQYESIFSNVDPPKITRHKVKFKRVTQNEEPLEKLHVYHVKVKANERKAVSGLGEIPNDIDCVNDLLLYNSGKNLYKKFEMSDALQMSQQIKEQEISNNSSIGAAPHSISERSTLTRSSTQNYFYTPNLGEVPTLDVPLDLPDLPNVADDLRYNLELDPAIAPSVLTTPNIPDLPAIDPNEIPLPDKEMEIELPPPPPSIEETASETPTVQNIQEVTIVPEENIQLPEPPTQVQIKEEAQPPKLPEFDIRASLMEAIRQAGGTKNLKSTVPVKTEKTTKPVSSGDLMADLHAKLSMRRKGISGTKKPETLDASSAMEKISAMIPPPSVSDGNDNTTEDEDWDD